MKRSYGFSMLAAAVLLLTVAAGSAMAQQTPEPVAGYAGHIYFDVARGQVSGDQGGPVALLVGDVYNNTNPQAPANFGFSSTDLNSIFGDRVTTTGTGILAEDDFTVFNSPSSAGNLLTASFNIGLYDGASNLPLGGYLTGVVNFGAGLPPGFFSIITVTGLAGLNINLNTTDVLIVQQAATHTGPANRLGIASLDPPTIGASTNVMYINSLTVGPAGYYFIGNPPLNANPGYRINVTQPVPATPSTWGRLKASFR